MCGIKPKTILPFYEKMLYSFIIYFYLVEKSYNSFNKILIDNIGVRWVNWYMDIRKHFIIITIDVYWGVGEMIG